MSPGAYSAPPLTRDAGPFRVAVKDFRPGARLAQHRDPAGSVCVVLAGRVRERDRRREACVSAGGALFRPGNELHSSSVECRGARVVTVSAGGQALSALAAEGLALDRPVQLRSPEVAATGARLQRAASDDGPGAALILEGLALELFGHVLQATRPPRAPRPPRWLAAARERLRDDPGAPHSLEVLARAAGVSAAHLAACFRDRWGESVGGFLRRLRVEEAARRLADTDQPLAEVALACGFCDQSHLTRTFRRHTGLTPGAWRRAARAR